MKHTLKSARNLAATLITFGSLAVGANAAILITELDHSIDYFEIKNTSSTSIDISEWSLNIQDDGLSNWSFTFSQGSSLAAGSSFGISDQAYFGAAVSTANIPNSNSRGIHAYVTDAAGLLYDAMSVNSGADTGGTIPLNFPTITGIIDWTSADAIVRSSNVRFEAASFASAVASPITSTSLTGTSSTTLTSITGLAAIPEPSSALILAIGALGFAARRRRIN